MFGLSKKDQKLRNKISTEAVKLPKDFAQQVLDLELLIDSGNFDLDTVDKLMKLYSNAVEYYSGMNDIRYVQYTERIQNMLVKPEILKLMKDGKLIDEDSRESALERAKKARMNMKGTKTFAPALMGDPNKIMVKQETIKDKKKKGKKPEEPP